MTHITIERAKLEQVLEALKTCNEDEWHSEDDFGLAKTYDENKVDQAIASCKQALAQPAQEQRPWVGLTDAEKNGKRVLENGLLFNAAEVQAWELGIDYAESKLKERNT
jgi:hypothetical protein